MEIELYRKAAVTVPGAEPGQMFGKPCYTLNGKAFVCFFQQQMVFKITGNELERVLKMEGSKLFDPSGKGRPMKEWVQVPVEFSYIWPELAMQAAIYAGL